MSVQHYRDLIAWQKAMELVVEIYRVTESFPKSEVFSLTNQLRRAAVSIPCNIAEGQGRSTTKDFVHFLHVSKGSLQEVETQIELGSRFKYLSETECQNIATRTAEVGRILNGLIRSLSGN